MGCELVLTLSLVPWVILSKTLTFSWAILQTDCRAEPVVPGKLILSYGLEMQSCSGSFVVIETLLMACKSAGNSRHPNHIDKIVGPSVHGKYLNLNCIQYMENNYGVSSSPRQVNLLTAFQRVVFTQDRSNTSQKSNSLRGNLRFGEMKINPRYLTFFVRISFLETNSQQHTADLAQLPATCAACSFFAASFHATVQLAG